MNHRTDKLLETLAKIREVEKQYATEKALKQANAKAFVDPDAHTDYIVAYPYLKPQYCTWTIGEAVTVARELEMHLAPVMPVRVGLMGKAMAVGFSMKELELLLVLSKNKLRTPRKNDLLACLENFGLKQTNNHNSEGGDEWEFPGGRVIMLYYANFPDTFNTP